MSKQALPIINNFQKNGCTLTEKGEHTMEHIRVLLVAAAALRVSEDKVATALLAAEGITANELAESEKVVAEEMRKQHYFDVETLTQMVAWMGGGYSVSAPMDTDIKDEYEKHAVELQSTQNKKAVDLKETQKNKALELRNSQKIVAIKLQESE